MKRDGSEMGRIGVIVSDGRQANFSSFEDAEKWLAEHASKLYACSWRVETKGKVFREYNTNAPI